MINKTSKFILFSALLASLAIQKNHAGAIQWVKEKKQTHYNTLSPRKKIMLGVTAGLTVSGLMYYALVRNDQALLNYLKHYGKVAFPIIAKRFKNEECTKYEQFKNYITLKMSPKKVVIEIDGKNIPSSSQLFDDINF